MNKAERAEYTMRALRKEVGRSLGLLKENFDIRYNSSMTAARLLMKESEENSWENLCTVSTDHGLHFAIWSRTEYHDEVKDILGKVLTTMGLRYSKGPRGCGATKHTIFDVRAW